MAKDSFLQTRLRTSAHWEALARSFFGQWEESGFGNLSQSKLEALLAYCLHREHILPANGVRVSLTEAHALNKEPAELDRLIAKGYTLFHHEDASTEILLDTAVRCLVSTKERIVRGELEFHCQAPLDSRYITELFERSGINPERGRNSRILQVDLSGIDGHKINPELVFYGLCKQLGIPISDDTPPPDSGSGQSGDLGGKWLLDRMRLAESELFKVGIGVVARELFSQLLHCA